MQTLEEVIAIAETIRKAAEQHTGSRVVGYEVKVRVEGVYVHVEAWKYGDRVCTNCAHRLDAPTIVKQKGAAGTGPTLVLHACIPCMGSLVPRGYV